MSGREIVRSGKCPFGEFSGRGIVRSGIGRLGNCPVGEGSVGELSVGELSGIRFIRYKLGQRVSNTLLATASFKTHDRENFV